MSLSTARDPHARMRADAYHSMADERGQLWHVQAAVWQVLVDGEMPWRRGENAFCRRCSGNLEPSYRRGVNLSKSRDLQKASTGGD